MIRKSRTRFASVETTIELWASSLRDVKSRTVRLFEKERSVANAELFLEDLLSEDLRSTGRMRSEAACDSAPWRQQALLGRDLCSPGYIIARSLWRRAHQAAT